MIHREAFQPMKKIKPTASELFRYTVWDSTKERPVTKTCVFIKAKYAFPLHYNGPRLDFTTTELNFDVSVFDVYMSYYTMNHVNLGSYAINQYPFWAEAYTHVPKSDPNDSVLLISSKANRIYRPNSSAGEYMMSNRRWFEETRYDWDVIDICCKVHCVTPCANAPDCPISWRSRISQRCCSLDSHGFNWAI
jgi:hypothetical protein